MIFPAINTSGERTLAERHVLGMAEMGYHGLSEQWLLRRAGDLHWRLIARAMGQKDAAFTCSAGEPLYAAFCATSINLTRSDLPRLGATLTLAAELYRIGKGRLGSLQRIYVGYEEIGWVVLISTFVGRTEPGNNRSIVRRAPKVLAIPPEAPRKVQRIAQRAANIARVAVNGRHDPLEKPVGRKVLPCPSTDFNAAGLLYFPSFSALAERASCEAGGTHLRTIESRHVLYLSNVEPGEWIEAQFREVNDGYDCVLQGTNGRVLALMRARFSGSHF